MTLRGQHKRQHHHCHIQSLQHWCAPDSVSVSIGDKVMVHIRICQGQGQDNRKVQYGGELDPGSVLDFCDTWLGTSSD